MGQYFKLSKGTIKPVKGEGEMTEMSGMLTGLFHKVDKFKNAAGQDVEVEKLYVTLKVGNDYNHISTFFDSTVAQRLISYLGNADVSKELTLATSLDDKGYGQVFVKQGDSFLKGSFKSTDLPAWQKVQISRTQTAFNKDAWLDALKGKVDEIAAKLPKFERQEQTAAPQPEVDDQSLPF